MKNLFLVFVLLIAGSAFGLSQLSASHALASDIYYEPVGQDSLLIRVNLYRDCYGVPAPTSIQVKLTGCNMYYLTYDLNLSGQVVPNNYSQGTEVSPLCPSFLPYTTCNNGSIMGVQHYQYSGKIKLSLACPDWKIYYNEYTRNEATTNLVNPSYYDLYVEATLNNMNGLQNTSPVFKAPTVPYFCYQENVSYNLLAYDTDGDSLAYSFITPMTDPGTPAVYVSGYSTTNPLSCNNTFRFDSLNGQISFTPQSPQVAVIAIRVDEYRNGNLIGSTMRDMELIVLGSPVCNPPYYNPADAIPFNISGGNLVSNNQLEACLGDTLRFSLAFKAPSPGYFENIQTAIPGASYSVANLGVDSFRLDITVPVNSYGQKSFLLSYGTTTCPITRSISNSYYINVLTGISAGNDLTYCIGGVPAQLTCSGGTIHSWSPSTGLSNPNVSNPLASPTTTTTYVVQSNLGNNCTNTDTVTVRVVSGFAYTFNPNTDTVNLCTNNISTFTVEPDSNFAPYTFNWFPSAGLSTANAAYTTASPDTSTTYKVAITSDDGCTLLDSIRINITGYGPKVTITPDQSVLCADSSLQLNVDINAVHCGASISNCATNPMPHTYSTSTGTLSYVTPFNGSASDSRFQSLFRANDLLSSGLTAGTISKIRLIVQAKGSNAPYENFTIRLGCTDETELNRIEWQPNTVEVFSAPYYNSVLGDNDFAFTQNYDWDGASNLVLEICFGSTANNSFGGDDTLTVFGTTYPASMSAKSQNAPDGCSLPAHTINSGAANLLPLVTFYGCSTTLPAYTYQWTPSSGLSNPNALNPIATPLTNTNYLLTIDDGTCTGQATTNIRVNNFSLSVSNDTILCSADTIQLNATVSGVFQTYIPCSTNGNYCNGNRDSNEVGPDRYVSIGNLYPTPYGHYYQSARQQYLYTAAYLTAAGITPGRITALAFQIDRLGGVRYYHNFSIKIKCTSSTELQSNTFESGPFTEVFHSKTVTLPSFATWLKHDFDNAFDWDGTTSLLIEICFDNTQIYPSFSANSSVYYSDANYIASMWKVSDLIGMCSNNTQQNITGQSTKLPNILLYTCTPGLPYDVQWSPATGLDDAHSANPIATPTVTTQYIVTAAGPGVCSKFDTITVYVNDGAQISVTSNPSILCPDTGTVTFTANVIIGGPSPTYQWFLNGNAVGGNSTTLTLSSLSANDSIWCEMNSNNSCALNIPVVSNKIIVFGANGSNASVTISSSPSPICAGTLNGTFTATAINGGLSPQYQWTVNGISVGTNSNTYTVSNLHADDTVRCTLTSSIACLASRVATSNGIIVKTLDTLSVQISANQFFLPCASNNAVSFTAQAINAGPNVTYQWYKNNFPVGTNSDTLWVTNILPNDVIKCYITSATLCNANSYALSNELVLLCVGIHEMANSITFNVQPNPSSGLFYIDAKAHSLEPWDISVYDITGKQILHQTLEGNLLQHPIDLSTVGKGVYILKINNGTSQAHQRLVVY